MENLDQRSGVIPFVGAQKRIPSAESDHSVTLLERGTVKIKLSLPVRPTVQTPHTQDEMYIIVRGHGVLVHDGKLDSFEAGNLLFVAAGTEHQFENCSGDLCLGCVLRRKRRRSCCANRLAREVAGIRYLFAKSWLA
jgi:mannose-6-phosphate isomerase-like protein (cupin superfamily)